MAWCHQAPSHYLSQCWPKSLPPHGITKQLCCLLAWPGHHQPWYWQHLEFPTLKELTRVYHKQTPTIFIFQIDLTLCIDRTSATLILTKMEFPTRKGLSRVDILIYPPVVQYTSVKSKQAYHRLIAKQERPWGKAINQHWATQFVFRFFFYNFIILELLKTLKILYI